MTIPTLALTGFALVLAFLLFAVFEAHEPDSAPAPVATVKTND